MIEALTKIFVDSMIFIASYDVSQMAFGFCAIGLAFALFYNMSGAEKL